MLTNIYTQFAKLAIRDFIVGTVLSISGEYSTLEDPNGFQFTALGTNVSPGNNAYVKDGIITGQAPTLPTSEVIV